MQLSKTNGLTVQKVVANQPITDEEIIEKLANKQSTFTEKKTSPTLHWRLLPYSKISEFDFDTEKTERFLLKHYFNGSARGLFYLQDFTNKECEFYLDRYNKEIVVNGNKKILEKQNSKWDVLLNAGNNVYEKAKAYKTENELEMHMYVFLNVKEYPSFDFEISNDVKIYNKNVENYNRLISYINMLCVRENVIEKMKPIYTVENGIKTKIGEKPVILKFKKLRKFALWQNTGEGTTTWLNLQKYKLNEVLKIVNKGRPLSNRLKISLSNYRVDNGFNRKWISMNQYLDYADDLYREISSEDQRVKISQNSIDWDLYAKVLDAVIRLIKHKQVYIDTCSNAELGASYLRQCNASPSASLNVKMSQWLGNFRRYHPVKQVEYTKEELERNPYAQAEVWLRNHEDFIIEGDDTYERLESQDEIAMRDKDWQYVDNYEFQCEDDYNL